MLRPYKRPMMMVREYTAGDLEALRAIHVSQGFEYPLPDLSNPLFVTKLILADASEPETNERLAGARTEPPQEKIIGAAVLRLTAEAYLLLDPKAGTPRQRWQWLLQLHAATERDAWQRGLEDVHAWLPPPIAQRFGKRITQLGWNRDDTWTPYCKRLAAPASGFGSSTNGQMSKESLSSQKRIEGSR
jgi:hypothetical protein